MFYCCFNGDFTKKKKKEKFINVDEEWEKVDQGHEQVVDWRGKREM